MKPIKLTMTAFGPYKHTEVIQFSELEENSLFVISGTTGSGKTTIFDGICFALYGQASGEDRTDFRSLRSDFAEDAVQTAVELVFAIKDRQYRIMRQVPYTKAGNKRETQANVEFYEITADGEIPCVDRQIVSEVNEKAEQLIGFTATQFNQIVMLPQGEFRKFLTSNTENKETIMRKIFRTEPYRAIVERLKVKRAHADKEWSLKSEKHHQNIAQITTQLPNRTSNIFATLSQEHYNIQQILEGLLEEQTYYSKRIIEDEQLYTSSMKQYEEMVKHFHDAKHVNEKFDELDRQTTIFTKMTSEIDTMTRKSEQLELAEKAVIIEQIEMQWKELRKEQEQKQAHFTQTKQLLENSSIRLEQVEQQFKIEENKHEDRKLLTEKLLRLTDLLPAVADLHNKRQGIEQLQIQSKQFAVQVEQLEVKTEAESKKITSLKQEIEMLENSLANYDQATDELANLTVKIDAIKTYTDVVAQFAQVNSIKDASEREYTLQKEHYNRLSHLWFTSEAASLAQALHDGEACPVCGSIEHPDKAVQTEDAVSKEEVEQANATLSQVESAFRVAQANYEVNEQRLQEQKQKLLEQNVEIANIEEQLVLLMGHKNEAETAVQQLRQNREKLSQQREIYRNATEKYDISVGLLQEQTKQYQEVLHTFEREQAVYEHTLTSIPEDVRELPILEQKIQALQLESEKMQALWESIQKVRQETIEMVSKAQSASQFAEEAVQELEVKVQVAEQRFLEKVTASNFDSVEAYMQAKMDDRDRVVLRKAIDDFKQQFYAIRESKNLLTAELQQKVRTDLTAFDEQLSQLKAQYEDAYRQYNQSIELEKRVKTIEQSIKASSKEVEEVEKEYSKITNLYDIVRGQNHLKLSFERYIQIEYLEQVIFSANERLRDISNGQFELVRSDRQESRGRQSGLGLDVYDAYTGQNRDVKTLSGGEKFNASLALALGMADVIQSFQGAVSIDTMFIDEGFGSLDGESLHKAIDTLIDLQKSGRMIGVISHVEELKAALPAILEVKKSKEGHSSTKFVIK